MLNFFPRYLRNTDRFSFLQPQQAQLTVSLSCVLYLQSSLTFVDPRVAEEEKRSNVTLCLHELHLYAIDHWVDHLLALSKSLGSHPGGNGLELLVRGLERLTDMHKEVAALRGSSIRNERGSDSTQREHSWQTLEVSPATRSLLDRALVYRESASVDESQPYVPPCKCPILSHSNLRNTEPLCSEPR